MSLPNWNPPKLMVSRAKVSRSVQPQDPSLSTKGLAMTQQLPEDLIGIAICHVAVMRSVQPCTNQTPRYTAGPAEVSKGLHQHATRPQLYQAWCQGELSTLSRTSLRNNLNRSTCSRALRGCPCRSHKADPSLSPLPAPALPAPASYRRIVPTDIDVYIP